MDSSCAHEIKNMINISYSRYGNKNYLNNYYFLIECVFDKFIKSLVSSMFFYSKKINRCFSTINI